MCPGSISPDSDPTRSAQAGSLNYSTTHASGDRLTALAEHLNIDIRLLTKLGFNADDAQAVAKISSDLRDKLILLAAGPNVRPLADVFPESTLEINQHSPVWIIVSPHIYSAVEPQTRQCEIEATIAPYLDASTALRVKSDAPFAVKITETSMALIGDLARLPHISKIS